MGADKGTLVFHDRPQAERTWHLLNDVLGNAYVSVNPEQRELQPYRDLPQIVDQYDDAGPAGGLMSAWRREPDAAWLVLAVDMPLVDRSLLETLISRRDTGRIATAYRHSDGTVEPACTIWEPAASELVRRELETGRGSLRRVLEENDVLVLDPTVFSQLESVNTPAERDALGDEHRGAIRKHGARS